jgi:hypothetical protein
MLILYDRPELPLSEANLEQYKIFDYPGIYDPNRLAKSQYRKQATHTVYILSLSILEFCDFEQYDGQKGDVRVDHARTDCRISRHCAAEFAAI